MSDVDDLHDAETQRETTRQQEQEAAVRDSVQEPGHPLFHDDVTRPLYVSIGSSSDSAPGKRSGFRHQPIYSRGNSLEKSGFARNSCWSKVQN